MRKWIWIVGLAALAACNQQPNTPQVLKPGGWVEIDQKLDVNVVFVGFQEGRGKTRLTLECSSPVCPPVTRPSTATPTSTA
ncbi:MAG: hypothetical protein K6T57_00450 [Thermaceae bacterium]|nr:hypothetical protein [Thermaceae bacterium]